MKPSPRQLVPLLVFLIFGLVPNVCAEKVGKSHEQCLKLVPGDWGSNFGPEWQEHEAIYWACRLGVSSKTVEAWQALGGGMIQDILPKKLKGQEFVFIEWMEGSAHCFTLGAFKRTPAGWKAVLAASSSPDSEENCTLACPPPKMKVRGDYLTVKWPSTSDPKEDMTFSCKHIVWTKQEYRWNGNNFAPINSKTSHTE